MDTFQGHFRPEFGLKRNFLQTQAPKASVDVFTVFFQRRAKPFTRFQYVQARGYKLFFFISETAKSQARAVSAMYVSDGLTQEEETIQAPSVIKRFFAS